MIRLLFVLFVTLGGFAALALWSARDGDPRSVGEKIVSPELRAAMQAEVDRLAKPESAEKPVAPARAAVSEPKASRGELAASPPPAPTKKPPASAAPKARARVAANDAPKPEAVAKKGAGGSAAPRDDDAEAVVELAEIAPAAEFAPDFGPASDRGTESTTELLPTGDAVAADEPAWDEAPHDADRSARLIRRMLAVYRDAGVAR